MTDDKTEFRVEVVRIGAIRPHPNADTLSLTDVNGYPVVIKTGVFHEGDLAVYVPVDSLVLTSRPEFAFLRKEGVERHRVRAARLRGIFSMGLLVRAPDGAIVGALVDRMMEVEKYLTPSDKASLFSPPPKTRRPIDAKFLPIYGLDPYRKFKDVLQPREPVVITEKIHGCVPPGARILMSDGSYRRMKDVRVGDFVMGEENGAAVASEVLALHHNGETHDWLEFHITSTGAGRGPSERILVCTPNHEVWTPTGYRAAETLVPGDEVCVSKTKPSLNPIQRSVLTGKLLGDGCISGDGRSVSWGHRLDDKPYSDWTAKALGDLAHPTEAEAVSGFGTLLTRQKIKSVSGRTELKARLDMTTTTHNYFAGGVLIHNCNARFCFKQGRLWVGSHKVMRGSSRGLLAEFFDRLRLRILRAFGRPARTRLLEGAGDVWWECAEAQGLKEKCASYPDVVFYGEIYGEGVQDLTYDSPRGRKFRLFDMYHTKERRFFDYDELVEAANRLGLETCPVLFRGPWSTELLSLAEGKSTLGNHTREGFVVRSEKERFDPSVGRVSLKVVGESYLLRKEG